MLRYAIVNAAKTEPFPRGRGLCPACGGVVVAKCGRIKSHHWAHEARKDCDPWAEHLGAWHLSWQNLVRPEFVEVPMPPHRADIVGVNGTVIELQHSPLGWDDVQRREEFYGTMVWVFDCTHRFDAVRSGDRCFFSLGKTQQIHACRRPVFLDFGEYLVEVVRLDNLFYGFSGHGIVRDRSWFLDTFLCERTRSDSRVMAVGRTAAPLDIPRFRMAEVTRWIVDEKERAIPEGEPFVFVDYESRDAFSYRPPAWQVIIAQYPAMANGWTREAMSEMKMFLRGSPVILDGRLRLLPCEPSAMRGFFIVEQLLEQLDRAYAHVATGRIPILPINFRDVVVRCGQEHQATLRPSEVVRIRRAFLMWQKDRRNNDDDD